LETREYRDVNREKINEYFRRRKKEDIEFKLGTILRSRIRNALRGGFKLGSFVRDLGCTIPELKTYLEKQFQPGMTWDNWSLKGWHIDHQKALANFNLADRNQFLQACHYTNLQPMWAIENIRKSNKQ